MQGHCHHRPIRTITYDGASPRIRESGTHNKYGTNSRGVAQDIISYLSLSNQWSQKICLGKGTRGINGPPPPPQGRNHNIGQPPKHKLYSFVVHVTASALWHMLIP